MSEIDEKVSKEVNETAPQDITFEIVPQEADTKVPEELEMDDKVASRSEKIFKVYDREGTGSIDLSDFPDALRSGGLRLTNKQILQLSKELKADLDFEENTLDMKRFQRYFLKGRELSIGEDDVEAALKYFTGEDGNIDMKELIHSLTTLGDVLNQDEIETILKDCGCDIGYDENLGDFKLRAENLRELIQKTVF